VLEADPSPEMAIGILPLGTANDFARGCGVPLDPYEALALAAAGKPVNIDAPSVNGVAFVNVASGGFGAEVTAGTPTKFKKAMGGSAYALVGILTAAKMKPYSGRVQVADEEAAGSFIVMAVGNARQAGGGLQVTPEARLDDGLLDVLFINDFQTRELGQVVQELEDLSNRGNRFVHYRQVPSCEVEVQGTLPINLDGEPHVWGHMTFEIRPRCLPVVLPEGCPLVAGG
jgi:YegS/Rv2252/BmrU family lipid kinase